MRIFSTSSNQVTTIVGDISQIQSRIISDAILMTTILNRFKNVQEPNANVFLPKNGGSTFVQILHSSVFVYIAHKIASLAAGNPRISQIRLSARNYN